MPTPQAPRRRGAGGSIAAMAVILTLFAACNTASAQTTTLSCGAPATWRAGERCSLLSSNPAVLLRWIVSGDVITFNATYVVPEGTNFIGLGLSETGSMKGADLWTLARSAPGAPWDLVDRYATDFAAPTRDLSQDVTLRSIASSPADGTVSFVLARRLNPCDAKDLPITNGGSLFLMWAFGPTFGYHGTVNRGARQLILRLVPGSPILGAAGATTASAVDVDAAAVGDVAVDAAATSDDNNNADNVDAAAVAADDAATTKFLDLRLPPMRLDPPEVSFYVSSIRALPADRQYHLIYYEAMLASPATHHIVVYACPRDRGAEYDAKLAAAAAQPPLRATEGANQQALLCPAVWLGGGKGQSPTTMPPDVGLPFGAGGAGPLYVRIEVHFVNPSLTPGLADPGSGLVVTYTPIIRKHNAGIMTLGQFGLQLPPGLARVNATVGACPAACTSKLPGPVRVLTSVFHMHGAARAGIVRRYRAGKELAPLAQLRTFDYNFHTVVTHTPDVQLMLPGDRLELTCTYDTRGKKNTTTYGSLGEMCFDWSMYYPAAPEQLDFCAGVGDTGAAMCGHPPEPALIVAALGAPREAVLSLKASGQLVVDTDYGKSYTPFKAPACSTRKPARGAAAHSRILP